MHPYEVYQVLRERDKERILKVRLGSLYHTVGRLAERELMRPAGTDRVGSLPERTTYEITDAGRQALSERLAELIRTPVNEYPAFPVALGEAHNLPRSKMASLVAERITRVQEILETATGLVAIARDHGASEADLLAADYVCTMHRCERDWLRQLAERLENGELSWPTP